MESILEDKELLLKGAVGVIAVCLGVILQLLFQKPGARVNTTIKQESAKIVDKYSVQDIEDLPQCKGPKKLAAFCRCWKSSAFPFCDGAHAKHNKETGDNLGPLLVTTGA